VSATIDSGIAAILLSVNLTPHKNAQLISCDTLRYRIPLRLSIRKFVSAIIDLGIILILFPVNLTSRYTVISHTAEMELFQIREYSNRLGNHCDLVPCESQQKHVLICGIQLSLTLLVS
jgi:hypothetical protein